MKFNHYSCLLATCHSFENWALWYLLIYIMCLFFSKWFIWILHIKDINPFLIFFSLKKNFCFTFDNLSAILKLASNGNQLNYLRFVLFCFVFCFCLRWTIREWFEFWRKIFHLSLPFAKAEQHDFPVPLVGLWRVWPLVSQL